MICTRESGTPDAPSTEDEQSAADLYVRALRYLHLLDPDLHEELFRDLEENGENGEDSPEADNLFDVLDGIIEEMTQPRLLIVRYSAPTSHHGFCEFAPLLGLRNGGWKVRQRGLRAWLGAEFMRAIRRDALRNHNAACKAITEALERLAASVTVPSAAEISDLIDELAKLVTVESDESPTTRLCREARPPPPLLTAGGRDGLFIPLN